MEKLLAGYLPMSEPSFLILLSLLEPRHGYGIMQRVLERTQGRVSLGAGTVYTILLRMERDGLISVVCEKERRKVYQIEPPGRQLLEWEIARLEQLVRLAREDQTTQEQPRAATVL